MLAKKNNWYSRDITVYKDIFDVDDKVILAQKVDINSSSDIYPQITKTTPRTLYVTRE